MTTLKIFWKEQQDMRRVQASDVNETLRDADGRAIANPDQLSFQNLKDYVLLVFREMAAMDRDPVLYYTDDDDEQVRITNDAELEEAFRLMGDLAVASGKPRADALVKIIVATKPKTQLEIAEEQTAVGAQQKKVLQVVTDLSKLIEQWDADSSDHEVLKRDLLSLLHEPGCQDALMEILVTPTSATLFQQFADEFSRGSSFNMCLRAVSQSHEWENIARVLLLKCPHARLQVERVLQVIQENRNVQMLSVSDVFENISVEETKEDVGPILAEFEADVTCPDGTVLETSQGFDKVWRLKNTGPKKWPLGCALHCTGGDRMQAPSSVPIPSVKPGKSIDVSLHMTAPAKAGRYTGYWRLSTEDGTRFGQRFWVDINVISPAAVGSEIRVSAPAPVVSSNAAAAQVVAAAAPVVSSSQSQVAPQKTEAEVKWEAPLRALGEMGFTDTTRNIALLEEHDGELTAVISNLL